VTDSPAPGSRPSGSQVSGSSKISGAGKGRPTPKRSEQQRRRTGPVGPPPQTRKEAVRRQREQMKEQRRTARSGAASGDERFMFARDAGPVRRMVRDIVDARRSVGVLLLPLALVLVTAQLFGEERVTNFAISLWMTGVLLMVVDVVFLSVVIRRRVRAAFPEERKMLRHVLYGLLRSTVFRRWRMPPPAVAPPGLLGRG
jgi:hypothetical protein